MIVSTCIERSVPKFPAWQGCSIVFHWRGIYLDGLCKRGLEQYVPHMSASHVPIWSGVCAHEGDFVCPTYGTAIPCVCWIKTTRTRVWHAVFLVVVVVGMKQSMQACATEYMAPIINKIGRVCGFVGCMGEFVWTNITMLEK